jgi:hypothetical protein
MDQIRVLRLRLEKQPTGPLEASNSLAKGIAVNRLKNAPYGPPCDFFGHPLGEESTHHLQPS